MITPETYKAIVSQNLTDEEIEPVLEALYVFANKLVDDFLNLEDEPDVSNFPHERVAITSIPRHNIT